MYKYDEEMDKLTNTRNLLTIALYCLRPRILSMEYSYCHSMKLDIIWGWNTQVRVLTSMEMKHVSATTLGEEGGSCNGLEKNRD